MRTFPLALLLLSLLGAAGCASTEPAEPEDPAAGNTAALIMEVEEEASAPAPTPPDPRAVEAARAMVATIRGASTASFRLVAWTDETLSTGQNVSLWSEARVTLRRPDGLHSDRMSDRGRQFLRFDGKEFSVETPGKGVHARIAAPGSLGDLFRLLGEKYGIVVPLSDLFLDDPWEAFREKAAHVHHLGIHRVRGVACHHLAFANHWMEWQVWIAAEGPTLPRRIVISYLDEPGVPRFEADIDEWKLDPPVDAGMFTLVPAPGSQEIEILPRPVAGESDAEEDR